MQEFCFSAKQHCPAGDPGPPGKPGKTEKNKYKKSILNRYSKHISTYILLQYTVKNNFFQRFFFYFKHYPTHWKNVYDFGFTGNDFGFINSCTFYGLKYELADLEKKNFREIINPSFKCRK